MKNLLFLLPALLFIIGCRPDDLHIMRNRTGTGAGGRSTHDLVPGSPGKPLPDTLVYVSAVEFPEDYDWQRDTAYGTVPCRVSLFLEGERILSLPAGPGTGIAPDPDRMRIRGGHLYTDCPEGQETIVSRDGEELFRFPGRESLRGFLLVGGKVHTLGQRLDGAGFSYRINGVPLLQKDEGVIVGPEDHPAYEGGALFMDGDRVCFSYIREGAASKEIYFVENGTVTRSAPCPDALWVHDQRLIDGKLYRIEKRSPGFADPTLVVDGSPVPGNLWYRGDSAKCLLFPDMEGALVLGFSRSGGKLVPYFWKDGQGLPLVSFKEVTTMLYADGVLACISPGEAFSGGKILPFPSRMRLLSRKCAALCGGRLYLALTGSPNLLYAGGKPSVLAVHGFLTGLRVEVPEKNVSLSP